MKYEKAINESITFIEGNLEKELTVDIIAKHVGYSKYHFHRIFQGIIGESIMDYIRSRRLTNAAKMLLFSEEKIIDIAIYFGFESQEAFTRAFQRMYHLPPGKYRKIISKIVYHKEDVKMKSEDLKGWILSGTNTNLYEIGIDHQTFHKGRSSGYLKSKNEESHTADEFGTLMQQFKAERYLNKRVKLSGFLKTKHLEGSAAFWMRVDSRFGDVLQFDNMNNRSVTEDTDWNYYEIILDVSEESSSISFGALLAGRGHLWIDNLKFEEVDLTVPTTNMDYTTDMNEEPVNLTFESDTL
ncbi:putative DNA-binding protein [Bacillus sp. TS-2]|nr:putative DNA-binding protein [Bacillus sp. TS-2]